MNGLPAGLVHRLMRRMKMDTLDIACDFNRGFFLGFTDILYEESDIWNALAKGDRAEAKADAA